MWSTHPNINHETTLEPSSGHDADQEDAQATPSSPVVPQGDHELVFFINLLMHYTFVISLTIIGHILNSSQH